MDFLNAIILGVVEGLSEFLPISSTGHLMLAVRALGLAQTEFLKTFEIAIQLGAILAVAVLYWRRLLTDWPTIKRVAVAFIPTGIIGLAFYKIIKSFLLDSAQTVVWALFVGGAALIVFELFYKEKENATEETKTISYGQSLLIGVCQSLAIIPGVSRAAATIIGGLALGIKRKVIVEFSFLLAVPTMAAATGLDLIKNANGFSLAQWDWLGIGFLVSFLVALASIKFLLNFIKNHSFIPFGIYRIALALVFWLAILR
ncbi:MAG: undecaprenyl-diphosphate phosphatase [Candidatus Portnoybacteria bacterium]|nr:undecaprenyl-diphosphate phosphatase [Candidatus Portnoybacteria bacterium]